jgi:para-nitrobenzyl esterase
VIIETTTGAVRGAADRGVRQYLGIPYAAAPFGDGRFALPRPHEPWDGVRDATAFGPTPPQIPYADGLERVLPSVLIPGEEILNLNVWAPDAPAPGAGHPVMVWFYGGALTRGSTAIATYDGRAFARDGVVLVSVTYRLGAEGFSVLDDAPVNLGLADQVAALRWVQQNIAAFGGDPARVTIFGQSAGGACVAALLAYPDAPDLFARAIIQSGPLGGAIPRERARRLTDLMARDLGIATTRAAFATVPPDKLLACQTRVMRGGTPLTGGPTFAPVIGDDIVPTDPAAALLAGADAAIPVLLGYTTEEYRLWFQPTGMLDRITRLHLLAARLKVKVPGRAVRLYRRNRPGALPGEILGALATDLLLRVPMNDLADARSVHGGRTWMYEFGWHSPVLDLGAAHGLELGFVFDTLDSPDAEAFAGPDRPQWLADEMHAAWVRFAVSGDPGWPAWEARRPVMTFDVPAGRVVNAPRDDERAALSRLS